MIDMDVGSLYTSQTKSFYIIKKEGINHERKNQLW